jgi:hypothetical protein
MLTVKKSAYLPSIAGFSDKRQKFLPDFWLDFWHTW